MAYGGLSVEYQVFQSFSAKLIDNITDNSDPSVFANVLVQNEFLTRRIADNKTSANGISNYTKICNLLSAVDPAIKLARTPEKRRENFNKFLVLCHDQLELKDIAQQLADECRTKDPSYVSPFRSQPSSPAVVVPQPASHSRLSEKPKLVELMKLKGNGEEAEIIKVVAPGWKRFGARLDFDESGEQLDIIQADCTFKSPEDYCQALFQHWLKGNGVPATWEKLIELLDDFDQKHLAEKVTRILVS